MKAVPETGCRINCSPLSPPQSREDREEWRWALAPLWETEVRSVIQCRGINRPLRYGNLGETLYALLEATRLLAVTANNPFSYRMNRCCVYSAFDPRLLQLSVVGLVRTCLLSHPGTAVRVQVRFTARSLQIRVSGETSFWDSDILTIVKETARLHRGSLAVSGKTAAFSMQLLEKKDSCHLGGLQEPTTPSALSTIRFPASMLGIGLWIHPFSLLNLIDQAVDVHR